MAVGELALETKGKVTAIRVLSDGKLEVSYQGTGKLSGVEVNEMYTALSSPQPTVGFLLEGNGFLTSSDGDAFMAKFLGVGRPTGAGFKAIYRGGSVLHTKSSKLAKLNNAAFSWETEVDGAGNYHLKAWEWK